MVSGANFRSVSIVGLLILMFSLFAGYIMDFLNESGFDYSVSAMGAIVDLIFG